MRGIMLGSVAAFVVPALLLLSFWVSLGLATTAGRDDDNESGFNTLSVVLSLLLS
jgi:hypothetical protein